MKRKLLLILLSASSVIVSSCAREYDMDNIDKTLTVGGEELILPLGESSKMVVDSILDTSGIKELKTDENGNYYFNYSGSISKSITFKEYASSLSIPTKKHDFNKQTVTLPVLSDEMLGTIPFPYKVTLADEEEFSFEYDLSSARDQGVVRLDAVTFEDADIKLSGNVICSGVSGFPGFILTSRMVMPRRFDIKDPRMVDDTLVCSTVLAGSGIDFDPVTFNRADLSGCPGMIYNDSFIFKSLSFEIPDAASYKTIMGKTVSVGLGITMQGKNSGKIVPKVVSGLIDKRVSPVNSKISITGIPDYMKNAVLDLQCPLLNLELSTNATLPVKVDAVMTSYRNTARLADISASLVTDFSTTPEKSVTGRYVLANEELEAPGYRFISADIKSLVRSVPDSILLKITPSTYIGDPSTDCHTAYLDATTSVDIKYDVMLPLMFGPDILMDFKETISDLPDILGDIISKNDVSITGTAESTFPVDLALRFNLLDSKGKSLGVSSSVATIESAGMSGVPSVTDYSVDIEASELAKDVSKMEIVLEFLDGTSVNLNKNDYVRISLKVSVPGGVTFEIK